VSRKNRPRNRLAGAGEGAIPWVRGLAKRFRAEHPGGSPRLHVEIRMAILKIARMGHPVLLQRAAPVADPGAPEIRRLVADMMETMEDAEGAGLAAPQVHVPLRLFVFRVPPTRSGDAPGDVPVDNTVLINPEVELLTEERVLRWEGCLSIPGLRAAVPRAPRIRYRGVDCDGREIAREVAGFHAGVVQHENDHLDGILYPMRMTDFSLFGFTEELTRAALAEREKRA
jgi:peptide deformylase